MNSSEDVTMPRRTRRLMREAGFEEPIGKDEPAGAGRRGGIHWTDVGAIVSMAATALVVAWLVVVVPPFA